MLKGEDARGALEGTNLSSTVSLFFFSIVINSYYENGKIIIEKRILILLHGDNRLKIDNLISFLKFVS